MIRYVLKRLAELVPVLWAVITIAFFLARLAPGGPFDAERKAPPEALRQIEAYYQLDQPLWKQYALYLWGVARGDLGPSFRKPGRSVTEWILLRLPVSLELGAYALAVALALGLAGGLAAALRPDTPLDRVLNTGALLGICLPSFLLGPLLVLVCALWLGWLPVAGWSSPAHKVLPSLTLGALYAAYLARLTRGSMLEMLGQDFIRAARARGVSETRVVLVHALPGAMVPVSAFLGPAMAGLFTGSFVVETIFFIPGLGREFVEAAFNRDYTMVIGAVIVYAVLVALLNLAADLVTAWLDPRIRLE